MSRERNSGKSNNRNSDRRPSSPKSSKPSFDKPKRARGTDTPKEVAKELLILEKNTKKVTLNLEKTFQKI
jgi:hypothetical protein